MVDFSEANEEFNFYGGSEKKKTIFYDNKKYLVKFPDPIREKNKNISYINNAYSEYVGSNIFRICGFNVQNTILGKYRNGEKEKIVCACCDFTSDEIILQEFENLTLSINTDKKIGTELSDIKEVISNIECDIQDNVSVKFWDMFIIDALIGNTDRHNGNWGFLYNKLDKTMKFAPIYDNGSCLNPLLLDEEIEVLDKEELKNIVYNVYSCLRVNNKKIHYFEFIKSGNNKECNDALKRVFPLIDIQNINIFIDEIEGMSKTRKEFYKYVLNERYKILEELFG